MAAVKFWYPTAIKLSCCVLVCSGCLVVNAGAHAEAADATAAATADAPAAEAVHPAAALEARLLATNGIIANFTQQVSNAQGYVVEQASGTLHVAKPNFRWEVLDPYPQIILARGNELEIYDPDLEQVTAKSLDGAIDQAPLALLTQAELNLDEHFEVDLQRFEQQRYTLRPRSVDALFERMELVFRDEALLTLAIYDHSGQQTLIRFTEYRADQVIQSTVFELEYPPGTDFVRG